MMTMERTAEKPFMDQKRENLLVIDTDPGVRWTLEKGLAYSGYNV